MTRSAVAGLHATTVFHTVATRSSALTSGRGLRLQRVPEEDEQVDRPLGDPGADLLVAPDRAAEQAFDVRPSSNCSMVPVVPVA